MPIKERCIAAVFWENLGNGALTGGENQTIKEGVNNIADPSGCNEGKHNQKPCRELAATYQPSYPQRE